MRARCSGNGRRPPRRGRFRRGGNGCSGLVDQRKLRTTEPATETGGLMSNIILDLPHLGQGFLGLGDIFADGGWGDAYGHSDFLAGLPVDLLENQHLALLGRQGAERRLKVEPTLEESRLIGVGVFRGQLLQAPIRIATLLARLGESDSPMPPEMVGAASLPSTSTTRLAGVHSGKGPSKDGLGYGDAQDVVNEVLDGLCLRPAQGNGGAACRMAWRAHRSQGNPRFLTDEFDRLADKRQASQGAIEQNRKRRSIPSSANFKTSQIFGSATKSATWNTPPSANGFC